MKFQKIYFVGIKGVGLTSLAILAKEAGIMVRGSDVSQEFITSETLKKNNIPLDDDFSEDTIAGFFQNTPISSCLVITTSAHGGFDNPQVKYAKSQNIIIHTHGYAVGEFMKGELFGRAFQGISIAGSHGKTTVSSLLATAMSHLNADPTYTIGTSEIFPLGNPGHFGTGEYFIAEADEYISELQYDRNPKLLYQNPKYAIITNIDYDHPDFYKSIDQVRDVFEKFLLRIPKDGAIIANGDDTRLLEIVRRCKKQTRVITYGISSENEYSLGDYTERGRSIDFVVNTPQGSKKYQIQIPGVHNTLNALSVIALLSCLGFAHENIADALREYLGSKRRFEVLRDYSDGGLVVIDDYAHHPEEITKTLSAIRLAYPSRPLLCIFQPHTLSRTTALLNEFSESFAGVESLILLPVFITKREGDMSIDQDGINNAFKKNNSNCKFLRSYADVIEYVRKEASTKKNAVVVTMGAGDVYSIARALVTK